jgi:hypothetical protein
MAMAASPAPRKMALMRKRRTTLVIPPSVTWVYPTPCSTTHAEAPMSSSRGREKTAPATEMGTPSNTPNPMACTAVRAA